MCLILFQLLQKTHFQAFVFSSIEFSFSRFFNGYDLVLNVTVGKLVFEDIVPNNMSEYVAVANGK